MSRRITEKSEKQAAKLQRKIDELISRRKQLLDCASASTDFKEKADCWQVVGKIEIKIEKQNRLIRKLLTPQHKPDTQPTLFDFVKRKA